MPGFRGATRGRRDRYGWAHQQERARWKPTVDAGQAWCQQPVCIHASRWITPGALWALGHNDAGTAWIGPVHAKCNQRDGARRGAQVANAKRSHRHTTRRTARSRQADLPRW